MNALPLPTRTRAILVGLERYALGEEFRLPGAVDDAMHVADLLEQQYGVPGSRIELLLAPLDRNAALDRVWKPFTIDAFEQRITTGLAQDKEGGLLFVYWSGHGVIYRPDGQQYLIAAEATVDQLRSFRFNDISNVLVDANHAQFSHQVVVVDACRSALSSWSRMASPSGFTLTPADADPHRIVNQCQLFACSLGQPGLLRSDRGSALTNALLTELKQGPVGKWADFEVAFKKIRDQVDADSQGAQTPVVSFASGWDRGRFSSSDWAAAPSLHKLISDISWTPDKIRIHAMRSLRNGSPTLPDLHSMIAHLGNLPETDAIAPLGEFVARIVRALGDGLSAAPLRAWLETQFSAMQRAAIEARIDEAPSTHVLQLWYDEQPPGLSAALFDSKDRRIVGWGLEKLPIAAGGIEAAIGEWIDKAILVVGEDGDDLIIELCLPSALLATDVDRSKLCVSGQDACLDEHYAVILRSTDRLKNRTRRKEWLTVGRKVLERVGKSECLVRWAEKGATRETLLKGFFGDAGTRPVWIGIADLPGLSTDYEAVLDICFNVGLPALFWMRPRLEAADRKTAEARLLAVLGLPPEDLPRRLRAWRREEIGEQTEKTALLLDDPRRVPPWATPAGTAGTMKG